MSSSPVSPEKASALERGLHVVEPRRRSRTPPAPSNRRHTKRGHCVYCGVTMTMSRRSDDLRTWDHVVPQSAGGRLQLPACVWCNGKKASQSVGDWLESEALALRRSVVEQRDDSADPMQERIVMQIRNEDLARIRRELEYHAR